MRDQRVIASYERAFLKRHDGFRPCAL